MQSSTIHLEMGSLVHVIGKGWVAQTGPGAGNLSGGAGHGGYGGGSSGAGKAYGSYYSPTLPGSGGGNNVGIGGSGGGTIKVLYFIPLKDTSRQFGSQHILYHDLILT